MFLDVADIRACHGGEERTYMKLSKNDEVGREIGEMTCQVALET